MAPLSEALCVQKTEKSSVTGKESLWSGHIDLDWTVSVVPNGGYVIGLIIEACAAHQKLHSPRVVDPVHVSAHFLRPVQAVVSAEEPGSGPGMQAAPFDVRVKSVKGGSTTNNVQAELIQKDQTMVSAHIIFGIFTNANPTSQVEPKALVPPSPFARRIPLRTHPTHSSDIVLYDVWNFKTRISGKEDPALQRLNRMENRHFSTAFGDDESIQREPPGLEFGSWLTFEDDVGPLRPSMLPFCADIIKPLPELLPHEENPLIGKTWYATLTMSIEFKAPIRLESHSQRTLGLYSLGRFLQDPLGRHETSVEVWTAPPDEANDSRDASWRENQRCLAIATQTALCVPYDTQSKGLKARA